MFDRPPGADYNGANVPHEIMSRIPGRRKTCYGAEMPLGLNSSIDHKTEI